MSLITAPVNGTVLNLSEVPDPIFAAYAVGDGLAIQPNQTGEKITVHAPISGTALRVMPHAFVIAAPEGNVLVHIGINTIRLRGEGFTVLAEQGSVVNEGEPMVSFDPDIVDEHGYSPICAVVLMDSKRGDINPLASGSVTVGDKLMEITTSE